MDGCIFGIVLFDASDAGGTVAAVEMVMMRVHQNGFKF